MWHEQSMSSIVWGSGMNSPDVSILWSPGMHEQTLISILWGSGINSQVKYSTFVALAWTDHVYLHSFSSAMHEHAVNIHFLPVSVETVKDTFGLQCIHEPLFCLSCLQCMWCSCTRFMVRLLQLYWPLRESTNYSLPIWPCSKGWLASSLQIYIIHKVHSEHFNGQYKPFIAGWCLSYSHIYKPHNKKYGSPCP